MAKMEVNRMSAVVVLLVLQSPVLALARFQVQEHGQGSGTSQEGFIVDLMQYHHCDSPYATADLTLVQRVAIGVKSSRERAQVFHNQMHGKSSGERLTDSAFRSPVYSDQGSYLMQITIGTPKRQFVALMDTGSDLVWVQCAPCEQCLPQPNSIFVPSSSSSYATRPCTGDALCSALYGNERTCSANNTCQYKYAYGDGSYTQGDLASETVTLTSITGTSQPIPGIGFGCGHKQQGSVGNADGLVGLGLGPLSLAVQLGSRINNLFSYCLVDFYSTTTKTSPLLLGATGSTPLKYTPLVKNTYYPTYYYVTITGITVGGKALSYPDAALAIDSSGDGGVILDSGTTLTYLASRAYKPFVKRIASLISYPRVDLYNDTGLDLCYNLAGRTSAEFPAVVFKFTNLDLDLPPDNVFLQVDNVPNFCLTFQGSDLGLSILGNVLQQNFQIAYDRGNKRVGFAPKTC